MMPDDITSVTGYVEWAAGNLRKVMQARSFVITGRSPNERCGALLDAAVKANQAQYLN